MPIFTFDGYDLKKLGDAYDRSESGRTEDEDDFDIGRFVGYVVGISDAYGGVLFCIPEGVKVGQLASIVTTYLKNHPEKWNQSASELVIDALATAFPCKEKK
jgi:hypothetical protein